MEQDTQGKLKQIKASFRLQMNGVASQSMRDKGLGYKINWGIGLPLLKIIAKEYGKDYNLAIELWKENIRECKILATMIMPPSEMEPDIVDLWISQIPNQEIAEMLAFNLFQYLDDAKNYALRWLAADKVNEVICGYNVLARLFAKNVEFSEREINEFIDQAQATLSDENVSVRHSVVNALTRFGQMGRGHNKILKSAFKSYDLDIF